MELARALVVNKAVRSIELTGNDFDDIGGAELLAAVQSNERITYVGIGACRLNHRLSTAIKNAYMANVVKAKQGEMPDLMRRMNRMEIEEHQVDSV